MAFLALSPKVRDTLGGRRIPDGPALSSALGTMISLRQGRQGSGSGQAYPPTTKPRSAAAPACPDGFDDVDGGPECGVYIQSRGVEQVCIGRGFEGGHRPVCVALVPALDVRKDRGLVRA